MIDAFSCEMCGYGGYTSNSYQYEQGDNVCPRCGQRSWEIADPDDVGYFDDDRDTSRLSLASSPTMAFWNQFPV